MVLAPKMADVVCAQNFSKRKGTKPILQVTIEYDQYDFWIFERGKYDSAIFANRVRKFGATKVFQATRLHYLTFYSFLLSLLIP